LVFEAWGVIVVSFVGLVVLGSPTFGPLLQH
jgi:hypothetical protein